MRQRRPDQVHRAHEVEPERQLVILRLDGSKRPRRRPARIGHQNVQPSQPLGGLGDKAVDGFRVGHIAGHSHHTPPRFHEQPLSDCRQPVWVAPVDGDIRPFQAEAPRNRRPQPSATRRHEDPCIFQSQVHASSPLLPRTQGSAGRTRRRSSQLRCAQRETPISRTGEWPPRSPAPT